MTGNYEDRKCFVVMPFGDKTDPSGRVIPFDEVYAQLIKPALETKTLGISCIRCDEIAKPGWIHQRMFEHVFECDFVVVDISFHNPNVFYELGVRHALARSTTILIREKGTTVPFNLNHVDIVEYEWGNTRSLKKALLRIRGMAENARNRPGNDSPVHKVLHLRVEADQRPIPGREVITYQLRGSKQQRIQLVTGDLRYVRGIDIWVNSENTNMQMARHFDRSVSSMIRYQGAERDATGTVVRDTIQDELKQRMKRRRSVPAAEVIVTQPGALRESNGVFHIAHVASGEGAPGTGYRPVADLGACVRRVLDRLRELPAEEVRSVVFPLLGTGTARGDLESSAQVLIDAAIAHLQEHPDHPTKSVAFLAYTDLHLRACRKAIDARSDALRLVPRRVRRK